MLIDMTTYLSNVASNIPAFISSKNETYLSTINSNIDGIQNYLPKFIYPTTAKEMAGYKQAEDKHRMLLGQYISTLEENYRTLDKSVLELAATIQSDKTQVKDSFTEFEEIMTEQQLALTEKWEAKFQATSDQFELSKVQIEKVAGALASHTTSFSYKEIADAENNSKKNWIKGTLCGFGALAIYSGLYAWATFSSSDISLENSLARLPLALCLAAFIAYSARQVSIHGKIERYCREMQIELVTLDPFFARYNDDTTGKMFDLKISLANKFFGNGDIISGIKGHKEEEEKDDKDSLSMEDIKRIVMEFVKKK